MKQLRVLVVDPQQQPEAHTIEYGMIPMRQLLGAAPELVTTRDHCAVFQQKRARQQQLPQNRMIAGRHRTFGRIVVVRLDERLADLGSMSDADIEHWTTALG